MLRVLHETITRDTSQSLTCIDQDMRDFSFPYHRHPELEIVRIDESTGRVLVGDWSGRFGPEEIYVFGSNLPHAFMNDPGTRRARSRCLQFVPTSLDALAEVWPELRPLLTLRDLVARGRVFKGPATAPISEWLDEACERKGVEQIAALIHLLGAIAACDPKKELASARYNLAWSDRGLSRLDPVLRHIHNHATEPMSMDTLARKAGLSLSAFHHFFKTRIGCTPGAYVLDLRFSIIAHRLLESDDSIAEISFAAGFNHLSNFNRLFRRRFGCSPREYRKRLVENESCSNKSGTRGQNEPPIPARRKGKTKKGDTR